MGSEGVKMYRGRVIALKLEVGRSYLNISFILDTFLMTQVSSIWALNFRHGLGWTYII